MMSTSALITLAILIVMFAVLLSEKPPTWLVLIGALTVVMTLKWCPRQRSSRIDTYLLAPNDIVEWQAHRRFQALAIAPSRLLCGTGRLFGCGLILTGSDKDRIYHESKETGGSCSWDISAIG